MARAPVFLLGHRTAMKLDSDTFIFSQEELMAGVGSQGRKAAPASH